MKHPKAVIQKSGLVRLREVPAVVIFLGEILVLWIDGRLREMIAHEGLNAIKNPNEEMRRLYAFVANESTL